jgi:hypothetical protein
MNRKIPVLGLAALVSLSPITWAQEIPCDQIRLEIKAPSTVVAVANTDLLRRISGRADCRFTGPEVYRSAYGTKPLPRVEHGNDDNDD